MCRTSDSGSRKTKQYESGVRPAPNPTVDLMVLVYDDRLLVVQHLRIATPAINEILPEFRSGLSFGQTAYKYLRMINDFAKKNDLDSILPLFAEDGRVGGSEEANYQRILRAMHELTTAGLEVEYSDKSENHE